MEEIYYGRQIASLEKRISNNFSRERRQSQPSVVSYSKFATNEEQERKVCVDARQLVS